MYMRIWIAAALAVATTSALAAEVQRTIEKTIDSATSIEILNIAGVYTIEGTSGGDVEIHATVNAEDAALANSIELEVDDRSNRVVVTTHYPLDDYRSFHYPGKEGQRWSRWGSETTSRYLGEYVRVVRKSSMRSPTLWVDYVVRVPNGVDVIVTNLAGDITATNLVGELTVDTSSGQVEARAGQGDFRADTGSGDVLVSEHTGSVTADTGSGDVVVRNLKGSVRADTGSGDIRLENLTADRVSADTGSGDVIAEDVTVADDLSVDTGSGDVVVRGDLSGVRRIDIDTGSGNVELASDNFPAADIEIDTGSGRLTLDVSSAEILYQDDDKIRARIGDGNDSLIRIDTGSGRIKVSGG